MHSDATPRFKPYVSSAASSVTITRAPDAPIGCPSAHAPPCTLTFSCGRSRSRIAAIGTTANASLISNRSTSRRFQPVFSDSLRSAPIGALRKLSEKTGWNLRDVDLFEINEAFAVVPMAAMRDLDLPHEKVNVHGGACALGHPIGASGARVMVTLLAALETYGLKRGVASLCIGGGEATAVAIERLA